MKRCSQECVVHMWVNNWIEDGQNRSIDSWWFNDDWFHVIYKTLWHIIHCTLYLALSMSQYS